MKRRIGAVLVLLAAQGAWANPSVDALSKCLADSTTGKDRRALAQWLFVSMGAHPDMKLIARIPDQVAEDSTVEAGRLFSRLLGDACPNETKAAVRVMGPLAIQGAFTVLGQLAMQELMTNKDVALGMAKMEKNLDRAKLDPVLRSP
jgi:hypothetical protein